LYAGSWYVRKCANKTGNCRSMCRVGETAIQPATGICPKEKMCCILSGKEFNSAACGENSKTTREAQASEASTTV
ncbi:hypothetical protein PANDA_020989, partial [Ailuropoda melanoleuca]